MLLISTKHIVAIVLGISAFATAERLHAGKREETTENIFVPRRLGSGGQRDLQPHRNLKDVKSTKSPKASTPTESSAPSEVVPSVCSTACDAIADPIEREKCPKICSTIIDAIGESICPSLEPTMVPSYMPSALPSESSAPSDVPSDAPSDSSAPADVPSALPSESCRAIEAGLTCSAVVQGGAVIPCDEILKESQVDCSCADCARALSFKYTGFPCRDLSGCTEFGGPTPYNAKITITNSMDPGDVVFATDSVRQGEIINFGDPNGECIPESLTVTISRQDGSTAQSFTIDSGCDGDGLKLTDEYGGLTFFGYTCRENDVRNCAQEVNYDFSVCNVGTEDQTVYEFSFMQEEALKSYVEQFDLLEEADPADLVISQGECFDKSETLLLDRCVEADYRANLMATATDPATGVPPNCDGEDEITFGWVEL